MGVPVVGTVLDEAVYTSKYADLCKGLNLDKNASSRAWDTYLAVKDNYSLDVSVPPDVINVTHRLPTHHTLNAYVFVIFFVFHRGIRVIGWPALFMWLAVTSPSIQSATVKL